MQRINERIEIRHWGTDLVEHAGKSRLKVTAGRKIRTVKNKKVKDKTSKESNSALLRVFSETPKNLIKSITYDNGLENAQRRTINRILGTKSYF